jgi:hypothetical protein
VTSRWLADAPPAIRRLKTAFHAVLGLQLLLGIEAWMLKFSHGVVTAAFQSVTVTDALMRSAHAVAGYALFGLACALALELQHLRRPETARDWGHHDSRTELEAVK